MADGGTLFLDEIGDMPLELQPKLLRALQEREFERLGQHPDRPSQRAGGGSDKPGSQAAREQEAVSGRLVLPADVIPICLPPLRERVQDIPALTEFFVAKICCLPQQAHRFDSR